VSVEMCLLFWPIKTLLTTLGRGTLYVLHNHGDNQSQSDVRLPNLGHQ
jgi:uncharacterized Rossmann fold enzyme